MTGVDPTLEGAVRLEMRRLRGRPERTHAHPDWPRALAQGLHEGQRGLLMRLRRLAESVPLLFRAPGSLRHALEAHRSARGLAAAGLLRVGLEAIRPPQAIARVARTEGIIAPIATRTALADLPSRGTARAGRLPGYTPPRELGLIR